MKALKHTVTIKLEMLSLDTGESLLEEARQLLRSEIRSAIVMHDDGDTVSVQVDSVNVEF